MNAQQQQLFDELTSAIRRQPDCASLARYGGHIKALIAANEATREEITPEMYGLLRSAYAVRKREIEGREPYEGCKPSVGSDPGEANEEQEASEARIRVAVAFIEKASDTLALNRDYEQAKKQFGGNLPLAVLTAYEQRLNELEQIFEQQNATQKLAEFGLDMAATPNCANDFPYCE